MLPKGAQREQIMHELETLGGLTRENIELVSKSTGVPRADIFGVATFYHLLAQPDVEARVCQGLTCQLGGAEQKIAELTAAGVHVERVSCLGQCDRPPAVIDKRLELLQPSPRGSVTPDDPRLPINLGGVDTAEYLGLAKAREIGEEAVIQTIRESELQGRGGAGFPAAFKWQAVHDQPDPERYVVCNADEGEPGTFKDREIMLRRPHRMLEGLAIAAFAVKSREIYIYIRGEFREAQRTLENALQEAKSHLSGFNFHFIHGHGAYICGEETALLEAMEGRRGMPRLKPPFPTEYGFRGKPTLMNNVETLACVPEILARGGAWFKGLGKTEAGSKLYCVSGHIHAPGVYELPLGVTLDELVECAGGYLGTPHAFSPGGASSGFLPMSFRDTPLDFKGLAAHGSMLGSAGVVVLNTSVDMAKAALWQAVFFEDETCGQCAPCRIGCRVVRRSIDAYLETGSTTHLGIMEDLAWEMEEGSICGLGIAAPLPTISALKYFPSSFEQR